MCELRTVMFLKRISPERRGVQQRTFRMYLARNQLKANHLPVRTFNLRIKASMMQWNLGDSCRGLSTVTT